MAAQICSTGNLVSYAGANLYISLRFITECAENVQLSDPVQLDVEQAAQHSHDQHPLADILVQGMHRGREETQFKLRPRPGGPARRRIPYHYHKRPMTKTTGYMAD